MINLTTISLLVIAACLCYIACKLRQIKKAVREVYELPHGESLYSIHHHEFNAISLQYVLIAVRAIMHSWMKRSVATEDFEAANEWKKAITEIEKLIKTNINR